MLARYLSPSHHANTQALYIRFYACTIPLPVPSRTCTGVTGMHDTCPREIAVNRMEPANEYTWYDICMYVCMYICVLTRAYRKEGFNSFWHRLGLRPVVASLVRARGSLLLVVSLVRARGSVIGAGKGLCHWFCHWCGQWALWCQWCGNGSVISGVICAISRVIGAGKVSRTDEHDQQVQRQEHRSRDATSAVQASG